MSDRKNYILLTEYEYYLLAGNSMISMLCKKQLASRKKCGDGIELSMTFGDLEELIGHIAAESNHTRSKRKSEDLGEICDYLESLAFDIKRTIRNGG